MLLYLTCVCVLAAADGAQTSVLEQKFPDGSTLQRTEVVKDAVGNWSPHGKRTKFYANGQKRLEETYVRGVRHGPWSEWYESGTKSAEGEYRDAVKQGREVGYYHDGNVFLETNYVDGQRHGKQIQWHGKKRKQSEIEFDHGVRQGEAYEWYPDGIQQKLSVTFTEPARATLADKGFDPTYGARPLRRAIQKEIERTHWIEGGLSAARAEGLLDGHLAAMRAGKKKRLVYLGA